MFKSNCFLLCLISFSLRKFKTKFERTPCNTTVALNNMRAGNFGNHVCWGLLIIFTKKMLHNKNRTALHSDSLCMKRYCCFSQLLLLLQTRVSSAWNSWRFTDKCIYESLEMEDSFAFWWLWCILNNSVIIAITSWVIVIKLWVPFGQSIPMHFTTMSETACICML